MAILTKQKQDRWSNLLTGLSNTAKDHRTSTIHTASQEFPPNQIEDLYRESPIFSRIIDLPAEHAVRRWISVEGGEDPEFGKDTLDALTALDIQNKIYDLLRLSRLYGGSAILIGAQDGRSMSQELDLKNIQTLDHLNVLTRHEIFQGPLNMEPTSPNFRNPDWYSFRPNNVPDFAGERVHHSRVICLKGFEVSTQGRQDSTGWGFPVMNRVYRAVRRFETVFDYAEAGFKDMNQGIIQIEGLGQMLKSQQGGEDLVRARLELINLSASIFNMVMLDSNENYERRPAALAGANEIILRVFDELAAVAGIPPSIFYGAPPLGLSTDDRSGRITFYDSVANIQRRLLRGPLNRLISILLHSKDGPTGGNVPEKWSFEFLPLDEPSDGDRVAMRKTQADMDKVYKDSTILTVDEIRTRLKNDPNNPYVLDDASMAAQQEQEAANRELEMARLQAPAQEASKDPIEDE